MSRRAIRTSAERAAVALGIACVGAEVLASAGAWGLRALAGADVVGFCRGSLASSTALAFLLLKLLALVGTFMVPLVVLVGLARGGFRRGLLPGVVLALVLLAYFAGVRAEVLPRGPRHPCLRSDATEVLPGDATRVARGLKLDDVAPVHSTMLRGRLAPCSRVTTSAAHSWRSPASSAICPRAARSWSSAARPSC